MHPFGTSEASADSDSTEARQDNADKVDSDIKSPDSEVAATDAPAIAEVGTALAPEADPALTSVAQPEGLATPAPALEESGGVFETMSAKIIEELHHQNP
jgi:hypothetical protein